MARNSLSSRSHLVRSTAAVAFVFFASLSSCHTAAGACLPAAECTFDIAGHSFDLSPLCDPAGQGTTINEQGSGKTYQVNICGSLEVGCPTDTSSCWDEEKVCVLTGDKRGAVAKEFGWTMACGDSYTCNQCQVLASSEAGLPAPRVLYAEKPQDGLMLSYPAVAPMPALLKHPIPGCVGGKGPTMNIEVTCDCTKLLTEQPKATELPITLRVNPANHCEYTYALPSIHGCPVGWCALSESERLKQASGGASTSATPADVTGATNPDTNGDGSDTEEEEEEEEVLQGLGFLATLMVVAMMFSVVYLCGACFMHYRDFGHWGIPDTHIQFMSWALGRVQHWLRSVRDTLCECLPGSLSSSRTVDGHNLFKSNPGGSGPDSEFSSDIDVEEAHTGGEDSPFQSQGGLAGGINDYSDDI